MKRRGLGGLPLGGLRLGGPCLGGGRLFAATLCLATLLFLTTSMRGARADGRDYHEVVEPPTIPRPLTLPFEFGDAVGWRKDGASRGPLYRMWLGVQPGVWFGPVSLHLPIEGHYRNPGMDLGVGARATVTLLPLVAGMVPLRVAAQASYLFRGHALALSGGPMIGLGRLLHLAVLYGYETDRELHSVGVRIGIDLLGLADPVAAITHFVPQAPPPAVEMEDCPSCDRSR